MIDISIIYPKRLFVDFYRSIKDYKTVFFFVPILIGMFMAFLIDDSQKDSIDGLINSSLTSFVPILQQFFLSIYHGSLQKERQGMIKNVYRYFKRQQMLYLF